MRYRIALCGFSEFEYRAMHFSFLHPADFHESEYAVVDALSEADFAVVDADSKPAVKGVVQSGWLDKAVFVGEAAPDGAGSHLQRPIDPGRILRTLDELTARHSRPAPLHEEPITRVFPILDDVVNLSPARHEAVPARSTPVTVPTPPSASIPAHAVAGRPADSDWGALPRPAAVEAEARRALQSLAKANARAAARRARLASAQARAGSIEPLRDVLVLDGDRGANALLCTLLENFGFQAHSVTTIAQAEAELAARPYAAVFLDVALDEPGIDLLRRIRALPEPAPHHAPAVLMMTPHLGPADRVRAALAGVTAPLIKPLGRGDVARALEAGGVVLPADARRL